MITIYEALAIIKQNLPAATTEACPLERSVGRYLALDVQAPEPSPRFTNSAMDGYAVRWADVREVTAQQPATLALLGESQAGAPFGGTVGAGQAVLISTGAMLPAGADTVVPVEDTREAGGQVVIGAARRQGQDVRQQGEEFARGDLLLRQGTRLAAPQVALLAALGVDEVQAYAPCSVAILVTGSELVASGARLADHQIRDSNRIMLQAAVHEAGAAVVSSAVVVDELAATTAAIGQATADLILCTGGVSVGRHDHVKEAAEACGFTPLFWCVRQKPGKPLYLARRGRTLLFGLPGNPVSAYMCFAHYVRPLLGALAGQPFAWPTIAASAEQEIANHESRTNMIRVRLTRTPGGGCTARSVEQQGSHMLTSLVHADGYVIVEPAQAIPAGDPVEVYPFDSRPGPARR